MMVLVAVCRSCVSCRVVLHIEMRKCETVLFTAALAKHFVQMFGCVSDVILHMYLCGVSNNRPANVLDVS